MAADNGSFVTEALERVGLAAIGAVALTAERADALADELSRTGGIRREEAREVIEQTIHRWRGEAVRFTERAGAGLDGFFQQLGLVPRSDFEELELQRRATRAPAPPRRGRAANLGSAGISLRACPS